MSNQTKIQISFPTKGSPSLSMSKADWNKWISNIILFIKPLAMLYLATVIYNVQVPGHQFVLQDLYPPQMTLAIVLFVLNSLYDFFRKFAADTRLP